MEIKNVISDNIPDMYENLQGGTLINILVEEVTLEDVVKYKYKQLWSAETSIDILEGIKTSMLAKVYTEYLSSTDFYYARFSETGESVPDAVVVKRKEAREFLRSVQ